MTPLAVQLTIATAAAMMTLTSTPRACGEVEHLSERTTATAGQSRMIAFRLEKVANQNTILETTSSDETILTVLEDASVLAGHTIGYVRVHGQTPGHCTLTVGHQPLKIDVQPPDPIVQEPPYLLGPADGAVVWGQVTIGVEWPWCPDAERRVHVRIDDALWLEPQTDTGDKHPPHRQLSFLLDTSSWVGQTITITPVVIDAADQMVEGAASRVRVVGTEHVLGSEAETPCQAPRPPRFQDDRMNIGRHKEASGGAFFNNAGSIPAACFAVDVDRSGLYQLMIRAAGTRAQGALPTVAAVVNGEQFGRTNGRLLQRSWHRLAVGVPFPLESGQQIITPYFANDFYVPQAADRNLSLDRIEVVRVSDLAGELPQGPNMMAMMGAAGDARQSEDPYGVDDVPLRIGWTQPLEGQLIGGVLELEGRCWWMDMQRTAAPLVTLHINDQPVLQQQSAAPRFWVDPGRFKAGVNRVQLQAELPSGVTAHTPVQRLTWNAEAAAATGPVRTHHRFSIHEAAWEPRISTLLRSEHYPKERRSAGLFSNDSLRLTLPETLSGSHEVFIHMRGDHFEGAPVATVSLQQGETITVIGSAPAAQWWNLRHVASEVDVPEGPKQLVVSFENDHYVKDKGDRNLWLEAVILTENPREVDRIPPLVDILYPPEDHPVWMADAVVAEAVDNASLKSAELVLNGKRTGITKELNLRTGRFLLPLSLRSMEPGPHTIAICITDRSDNTITSEPRTIVVEAERPESRSVFQRAVHLLDRLAYGPDPRELANVLVMGEAAWLDDRLSASFESDVEHATLQATFPYFAERNDYTASHRAIGHLLLTTNPLRARFVLWAQNHFSTWSRKVQGDRKWQEHVAFSKAGVGSFGELLQTSAQSPAMLGYLDQDTSYAGRLNENYAREVMELHTLGVDGGYNQEDVTNLAMLLTGWTASQEGDGRSGGFGARRFTFRFDPALNDGSARQILGLSFPKARPRERYQRVQRVFELLASHPSTAKHIATRLAEHYVTAPAPQKLVEALTGVFLETNGDMVAMLRAMIEHRSFWEPVDNQRLLTSLDFAARLCRTTDHFQPWQVGQFLQRSGQGLFDRSSPDGYPQEDIAQANSNSLIQRWQLVKDAHWRLTGLVPGAWRYSSSLGEEAWAQSVIDIVAIRLTGQTLAETSNQAALDLVRQTPGTRDQKTQVIAPFIAQLPEANLK